MKLHDRMLLHISEYNVTGLMFYVVKGLCDFPIKRKFLCLTRGHVVNQNARKTFLQYRHAAVEPCGSRVTRTENSSMHVRVFLCEWQKCTKPFVTSLWSIKHTVALVPQIKWLKQFTALASLETSVFSTSDWKPTKYLKMDIKTGNTRSLVEDDNPETTAHRLLHSFILYR